MMKKHLILMLFGAMTTLGVSANAVSTADILLKEVSQKHLELLKPVKPTYVKEAVIPSWKDNWFINVQGGAGSFIGSPIGCEDLFGRIKPMLNISVGKWHTPSIGNRISFQGFHWKSGELQTQDYLHYHADFLLNLTPMTGLGGDNGRLDIIPFVGLGMVDNRSAKTNAFAINYGVQGRFKLMDAFHITAELSNATMLSNADGIGNPRGFGDNLLSLSAGISWTFGKNVGWKKVMDAKPYIQQNNDLAAYAYGLTERNKRLEKTNSINALIIAELKKVLNIEGLLEKYSSDLAKIVGTPDVDKAEKNLYPINDYSGLNSLRKRLAEGKHKANGDYAKARKRSKRSGTEADSLKIVEAGDLNDNANGDNVGSKEKDSINSDNRGNAFSDYLTAIQNGDECIGAPVYFFFELGTANLIDESQLVNLDKIAAIAEKYGLVVEITGAADSATGTEQINDNLGKIRSQYVADYIAAYGIENENIIVGSVGGTDEYVPDEANRNCIVRLFLPRLTY